MDTKTPRAGIPPSKPRPTSPLILGLAAIAIAAAIVALIVFVRGNPDGHPSDRLLDKIVLSIDETRRLESLRAEAIALLESARFDEAEAKFALIAEYLPDDEVVLRNVAIGRLLVLNSDQSDEAFQRAETAVNRLTDPHRASSVGYWLMSRRMDFVRRKSPFDEQERILSTQLTALFMAIDRATSDPVFRYTLRDITKDSSDPAMVERGEQALFAALTYDPDNLFLLLDSLEVLIARKATQQFAETVDRLQKVLEPLRAGLLRRTNILDPLELLAEARARSAAGDWSETLILVRKMLWIRSDDVAQADKRRVLPHPLEYVAHRFTTAKLAESPPLIVDDAAIRFAVSEVKLPTSAKSPVVELAWGDSDLDGRTDLWALRAAATGTTSTLTVYDRVAGGQAFEAFSQVELPIRTQRLLLADLDRDDKTIVRPRPGIPLPADHKNIAAADIDAIAYGAGGVCVLRNDMAENGARSLVVVAQDGGLDQVQAVTAATLGDFDHDGDLDLALATGGSLQIWINRGSGVFENVSPWSQPPEVGSDFTSLVAVDWDRDVDIDLVAVGPGAKRIGLFENLRHLRFRWRPLGADESTPLADAADVRVVEADGNASWDLLLAGTGGAHAVLTNTPAAGVVKLRDAIQISKHPATRILNGDFDNDGLQDAFAFSAERIDILRGQLHGGFAPIIKAWEQGPRGLVSAAVADFDGDGDLDVIAATADGVVLLTNEQGNRNPWLSVEVRGIEEAISGRVNNLGIGSVVELRSPSGHYQAQLVDGPTTFFGLGAHERAEVVRVLFTNGIPQSMVGPEPKQLVRESQKPIGSCPFLYVWDGEKYVFYTDLLWAAPLGLQTVSREIMPDRPWEYLKIDGQRLVPRDGHYELLLTEELWEAGYFDEVELLAVDHPAEIEINSNEKVGPPTIAEYKIHTVRQRRLPVSARDSSGRDVLPDLTAADGRYAECFQKTYRQGLAETHHLELDLGDLGSAQRVTLFLSGWIRPTDTSLNVALSQDSRFEGPRPPRIMVPAADGQWREAVPFMGFPGGKTKTIAVDLTDVLAAPDFRLRIETSAELRWDEAFFTVDEEPVECRTTKLELESADLHFGGFSKWVARHGAAPDWYDYSQRDQTPQWPPMRGMFTRYGDVRELLAVTDDRLAVLGAGDEITARFAALPPPPKGWKRDFILHNVGWDKDCVLNTILGQTVEPLPYQAMRSYPYDAMDHPNSPAQREYLRSYQNRQQSFADFWKQLSAPPRK